MFLYILLVALGLYILIKGADFLIENSTKIAKIYNIPQYIVGLTIVAMGTSLPELIVSATAALKGSSDIALANVAGSNIANILMILGVAILMKPLLVDKKLLKNDLVLALGASLILALLAFVATGFSFNGNGAITSIGGVILLISFLMYLAFVFITSKKASQEEQKVEDADDNLVVDKKSQGKYFLMVVVGLILMVAGANISVDNAVKIAQSLGMSERLIGLTIIAIGTSLPELVATVQAVRKGAYGLVLGNILGSNIYNSLFIIGVSALISPIKIGSNHLFDLFIGVGVTILVYVLTLIFKKYELSKKEGFVLIGMYILYYIYLFNSGV